MAAKQQVHTISFEGKDFKYDANACKSWKVNKGINQGYGPAGVWTAYDAVFCGDADGVAEQLGDDVDKVAELVQAVFAAVGAEAKN